MNLGDLRREYSRAELDERTVARDPFRQLSRWLDEATEAELLEPTAMTLATAGPGGRPSARIVLLKALAPDGLVFFTDTRSHKGRDLAGNPVAALLFYWAELERQVRVTGTAARIPDADAEAYFRSRPLGSRLSAWASEQSAVVAGRAELEARWDAEARRHPHGEVPRPPYWTGFRVAPDEYEFWQGRPNPLHDRVRYRSAAGGDWLIERLSP